MSTDDGGDSITSEITIRAGARRVFEALSEPAQRVAWWGAPGKFQAEQMESDLRPGGAWQMTGTGMGGKPFIIRGEYRRVEPPHLLESTWVADWQQDAPHTVVRFDLEENEGVTTVRLTHSGFRNDEDRTYYKGWPWLLALLQGFVEGQGAPGQKA